MFLSLPPPGVDFFFEKQGIFAFSSHTLRMLMVKKRDASSIQAKHLCNAFQIQTRSDSMFSSVHSWRWNKQWKGMHFEKGLKRECSLVFASVVQSYEIIVGVSLFDWPPSINSSFAACLAHQIRKWNFANNFWTFAEQVDLFTYQFLHIKQDRMRRNETSRKKVQVLAVIRASRTDD